MVKNKTNFYFTNAVSSTNIEVGEKIIEYGFFELPDQGFYSIDNHQAIYWFY